MHRIVFYDKAIYRPYKFFLEKQTVFLASTSDLLAVIRTHILNSG